MKKQKSAFRFATGFWFGMGFTMAAYITVFFMSGIGQFVDALFTVIMRGLGFENKGI